MGTQIIVIVTDDWVALAADSRIVSPGTSPSTKCKIRQTGRFLWAAARLDYDKITRFSVDDYFSNVERERLTASQLLESIGEKILPALKKELPVVERQAPDFYAKLVHNKGEILSLFVVDLNGERIEAYGKDFQVIGGDVVPQRSHTCTPEKLKPCLMLTNTPEVADYYRKHPEVRGGDLISAIDRLMEVAQAADPENIGPPFSILVVTKERTAWLRQNDCQNVH